ncbi:MAG TPA: wax ester/triacylglycerol synthase family O-acyltransferase [Rudaea sp.]|nr:wax ester/triacylglycerol synthase family O-acyltransferase [Rudaea sp.]
MPKRPRPLSGLDAGFLYLEAAGTPMHVGSVMLMQKPKRRSYDFYTALVAHMRERMPAAAPLHRVLHDAPLELGHPRWIESPAVDLDYHVQRRKLAAPGSLAQLWRLVGELHAEPLPRDRPLWQFVAIEGLASGEVALYSKIHHALLDGQGGIALARVLLDMHPTKRGLGPAAQAAPPPHRRKHAAKKSIGASAQRFAALVRDLPGLLKTVTDAARGAGSLLGKIRDSVMLAPRTPFNAQVGPQRSFAVASLSLAAVKRVAHHFDTSLNDVVLTLCASALRDYLLRRKVLPKETLIAAMPISLRASGDASVNNQVSMVQCALRTDIADPAERLQAIATATGSLKRQVSSVRNFIPTDFPGFAAPIWAPGLSWLWAHSGIVERLPPLANLVVSNVPGPPVTLYMAGSKIVHYYPVSIVTHGLGLNITVNSYDGWLEFGVIAGKEIAPKVATIASGLNRALDALAKKTGE